MTPSMLTSSEGWNKRGGTRRGGLKQLITVQGQIKSPKDHVNLRILHSGSQA